MSFQHLIHLTLLVLLLATPLQAAVKLEYLLKETILRPGREPLLREYTEVAVIDGARAYREDRHKKTILDTKKGEVILVHHFNKTFSTGRLPFRREHYVAEAQQPRLQLHYKRFATYATFEEHDEAVRMGSWNVRKVNVVAISPQYSDRAVLDVYLTTDIDLDEETYDVLTKVWIEQSFTYHMDSWVDELVALDGVLVRQESEGSFLSSSSTGTVELLSATEVEVSPETFQPPADYPEVPLDYSDMIKIKELPAGVSPPSRPPG